MPLYPPDRVAETWDIKDCRYSDKKLPPTPKENVHELRFSTVEPCDSVVFWNPIWLGRGIMLAFALAFGSMAFAIVVLYYVSRSQDGLSTQISSNRYSWTYGPTAVLVVLSSLWWKVDYSNKTLTSWQRLRQGNERVDRTLLLDYISPFLPLALYHAALNYDWAVVASSSAYLLLKLTVGTYIYSRRLANIQ